MTVTALLATAILLCACGATGIYRIVDRGGTFTVGLYDLALVALHRSDSEAAARHARRFLELVPPSDPRRHRGHLALAWSHDLAGRLAEGDAERSAAMVAARESRDEARDVRAAALEVSAWRAKPLRRQDCPRMQIDLYNSRRLG